MIVKRKNYNLQSKDYLENIEEKINLNSTTSILQKAKEVYNGLPFEFKGWVDIQSVEFFHGLKGKLVQHINGPRYVILTDLFYRSTGYILFKNLFT